MGRKTRRFASRLALLSTVFVFILISIVSNVPEGLGQQASLANIVVSDLELQVDFVPTFSIDPPVAGEDVRIAINANVANTGGNASGTFNLEMRVRREDESEFGSNLCTFVSTRSCNNLSLTAGESFPAVGSFDVDDTFESGRYIVQVRAVPFNFAQSSIDDDVAETVLLVGVDSPEYHPVLLSFSPPSPIIQGSQVTVRVEVENTGRPESPELNVEFSYCLPSPTCEENDFISEGFAGNGIRSLSSIETTPLSRAQRLVVTNTLDTTGLSSGRYTFKVSVSAPGVLELDPNNNEIQTNLTIGSGALGGLCQLPGEITTIGEGTGTQSLTNEEGEVKGTVLVQILYLVSKQTNGLIQLHAVDRSELASSDFAGGACPEIGGSPISLQSDVTTFTIDDFNKILYVGLENGQLYLVDVENADNLTFRNQVITGSELLSLSTRVSGANAGQVFIGTDNQRLYRVSVRRDNGILQTTSTSLCMTLGSPVKNLGIFQGKTYFTSGSQVFRIDETRCDTRTRETVFTALGSITALEVGNIRIGTLLSARIVVGTSTGRVHVTTIIGFEQSNSPVEMDSEVTAIALNTGEKARSTQGETAFVATIDGKVNAISLDVVGTCDSVFQSATRQPITVLSAYEPSDGSPASGWVFAGTADSQLLVVNDNCNAVIPAQSTQGIITSNILVTEIQGFLGPEKVIATYGAGPGLFSTEVVF